MIYLRLTVQGGIEMGGGVTQASEVETAFLFALRHHSVGSLLESQERRGGGQGKYPVFHGHWQLCTLHMLLNR